MPGTLKKIVIVVLAVPVALLFSLYVLVCFPIFVLTTACSLSITATRISVMLTYRRWMKWKASRMGLPPEELSGENGDNFLERPESVRRTASLT